MPDNDKVITSETPEWEILREAAKHLEEAENLLELTDITTFQNYGRDCRTIEVELLRCALDLKGEAT